MPAGKKCDHQATAVAAHIVALDSVNTLGPFHHIGVCLKRRVIPKRGSDSNRGVNVLTDQQAEGMAQARHCCHARFDALFPRRFTDLHMRSQHPSGLCDALRLSGVNNKVFDLPRLAQCMPVHESPLFPKLAFSAGMLDVIFQSLEIKGFDQIPAATIKPTPKVYAPPPMAVTDPIAESGAVALRR